MQMEVGCQITAVTTNVLYYHHEFFSSKELASLLVQQALPTDGKLKHFISHLYKRCIFTIYFTVNKLHFLSQYVTATLQPHFQPPKPRQLRLLLRPRCRMQGGWKLLGPATPHSPAATGNLQNSSQGQVLSLPLSEVPDINVKCTK